jgi:UDP-N-acetylglucosamine:LPS N-acetylglucosamine transferase
MGHISAANAIAEIISEEAKDSAIYIEDLFMQTFKSGRYNFPFRLVLRYGKSFYNYLYRHTENTEMIKKLPFNSYIRQTLARLIESSRADLVISTLPACSKAVSEYKELSKSGIPLITCITDVTSHSEWLQPLTNYYIIASPGLKEELVCKGVAADSLIIGGIPVRREFEAVGCRAENKGKKRLLIMGGGLGLLPKGRGFYEKINSLDNVKTTVITGKNKKLYRALSGRYENIEVLGYTDRVADYMKAADLLISKPGGITVFEAVSAELPLLFFPPFLQNEKKNGRFIIENGLGEELPWDKKVWSDKIEQLLNDREAITSIRDNIRVFKTFFDGKGLARVVGQYQTA